MNRITRFRFFALAFLFAVASLQSGCSLFKKCGGCPSFSKTGTLDPNAASARALHAKDTTLDAL